MTELATEIRIPWPQGLSLDTLNHRCRGTLVEHLDILFTDITPTSLIATMPVDHRTRQPLGLLHGGASVVLAESIGSTGANVIVNAEGRYAVGLEINANHLRPATQGRVTGISTLVHLGKTTHIWQTHIYNEDKQLTCISRLTMAIRNNAQKN